MRTFGRQLLAWATVGLVTLILAEGVLRVYHYVNPVFIFASDSYNRFRGVPFARNYDASLNSRGFNDVEFATEKEAGVYRIIGIGDSFVFSVVPYRHNFLTRLEERLNAESAGQRYEVVNMGIPGANLEHYRSLLVNEGLALHPDMLLLCVFIGNDLSGSPPRPWTASYVLAMADFLLRIPQAVTLSQANAFDYHDDQPSFGTYEEYVAIEIKGLPLYRLADPEHAALIRDAMGYLSSIQRIAAARDLRLLLVLIPDEMQINPSLQQAALRRRNLAENEVDFDLPNRLLTRALREAGIAYLDLLPSFRAAAAGTILYKPQDTHWNIAGNRLAAEVIAEHLLQRPSGGR
jgi:hypothetical protein